MFNGTPFTKGIESTTTSIESEIPSSIRTSKRMSEGSPMDEEKEGLLMAANETKK